MTLPRPVYAIRPVGRRGKLHPFYFTIITRQSKGRAAINFPHPYNKGGRITGRLSTGKSLFDHAGNFVGEVVLALLKALALLI
ncbi:MAG: hypothetical protein ACLVL7_03900, partial [Anaerotruncus massiliensis (ex Togo et al. 2019)]